MLILTIQKESVVKSIMSGTYKANFYKSTYGCISPMYTKGYDRIKKALSKKLGITLLSEDTPIWGWVGVPYLKFHKYDKTENLVAMFVDVPKEEVVLSNYDKFCDYIEGKSTDSNFIIDPGKKIGSGVCVQASFMSLDPEKVLLTVDYKNLVDDSSEDKSVERLYNSCKLYALYYELKQKSLCKKSIA